MIKALGFEPKENHVDIYEKKYPKADAYSLEVDFENKRFNYGELITVESKTTLNFSQAENWVVFECVDRLLRKGYQPQNITLEKTWATGHGTSGRLDVLVTKDDGSAFLMIECKTVGAEFDKELKKTQKDGGQLFTYFQQDRATDFLMLYASELRGRTVSYENQIIKIEEGYRQAANVKDLFEIWNKLPKDNGVFDTWTTPYHFVSKALTPKSLIEITQEDSSKIFNRFLEILRHNVVSDKPNAFNKIFTLFLCKIYDEKSTRPGEELRFQWLEGKDDDVTFQKRLTDLYAKGMQEFLDKKVTDFSEENFDDTFGNEIDESTKEKLLEVFTRIRLEKNNEFAIKEVFDHDSFIDNGKVVKEVVELLQSYQIRYTKKQQYLSDFFELLLTTGLKQESGQFFTPVPIAQFVIRSLPIDAFVSKKLKAGEKNNLLPTLIDYAAGSGHFLTESMHVIQGIINEQKPTKFISDTKTKIENWQNDHFDWASQYVYGVEKDYRLVKVGKVGCYLHGDGIANVVHSDGLGTFTETKEYTGRLKHAETNKPQDNRQFDIVISNPPYSVSTFRNNARKYYNEKDFELYNSLTDQSSEIECLFIERTKQLLKDGGVAGIILPSSILNNGGIYTKTREIILRYFEIIGITELGSNTFMATGTNTVTLFLRRRKNRFAKDTENSVNKFATNLNDVTIKGIETPVAKYVAHVWEGLTFNDYRSLVQKTPNSAVKSHEIYEEYVKKISAKDDDTLHAEIINREKEKLAYFILTYSQTVVLIKSGEKKTEKAFLGYEFSNRRGNEGIHPVQRDKSIDDCTKLYDPESFENPEKASTYIYDAFSGNFSRDIDESLKENVRRIGLADMLTFDRAEFDKSISLAVKKKVKIESQWDVVTLSSVIDIIGGGTPNTGVTEYWDGDIPWLSIVDFNDENRFVEKTQKTITKLGLKNSSAKYLNVGDIIISARGTVGAMAQLKIPMTFNQSCYGLRGKKGLDNEYLYFILKSQIEMLKDASYGAIFGAITTKTFDEIKIPLPPKDIQKKIVAEISSIELQENKNKEAIESCLNNLNGIINAFSKYPKINLGDYSENLDRLRKPVTRGDRKAGEFPYYGASGIVDYVNGYVVDEDVLLVAEDGANLKSRNTPIAIPATGKIWVNNHAHILKFDNLETRSVIEKHLNATDISEFITGQAQPKLNQQNLNRIPVPKITLSEQKQTVKQIEKIEAKIAKLEAKIIAIPQQKEMILKKYL